MRILLIILLLLASATLAPTEIQAKKLWAASFLGKPAPEFVVEKWLGKEPERKGKFVLIDFWATWCPPCREAIPELNRINQAMGDKVVVVGVSDEPEGKVRSFKAPKIEYALAIDSEQRMKKQLAVTGIPHVILVDPSGIVRWEGYPLLSSDPLTVETVAAVVAKYSAQRE